MKYIFKRDGILEKVTERELDRLKIALMEIGFSEIPQVFKPKISLRLRDDLLQFGLEMFGYKEGRRNVYIILKTYDIVKQQKGGNVTKFGEDYLSELRVNLILETILDTYIIKKGVIENNEYYFIKNISFNKDIDKLISILSWPKGGNFNINGISTTDVPFQLNNNIFKVYRLITNIKNSKYYHDIEFVYQKELSNEEKNSLIKHLSEVDEKSEYDEDLFS